MINVMHTGTSHISFWSLDTGTCLQTLKFKHAQKHNACPGNPLSAHGHTPRLSPYPANNCQLHLHLSQSVLLLCNEFCEAAADVLLGIR